MKAPFADKGSDYATISAKSKPEPKEEWLTVEQATALRRKEEERTRQEILRLRREYADHVAMERKFKH